MTERTPEQDRRIGVHEAGHCLISRAFDMPLGGATIVRAEDCEGKVWGPQGDCYSKLGYAGEELLVEARPFMPGVGELRDDAAPLVLAGINRCIELLAGNAAEVVLYPGESPINANNDWRNAQAYAAIVCCSATAIDDFCAYALAEAGALIRKYEHVVVALADTLVAHRTLTGAEIDDVIRVALATHDHETELARRKEMQRMRASAARFIQQGS